MLNQSLRATITLIVLFFVTIGGAFAQKKSRSVSSAISSVTIAQIEKICSDEGPGLVEIYKDLHANPELPFMEQRTAGIIAKALKSYGYDVKEGIGNTGVVGILQNGAGPVVMYRADMDCNAVEEAVDLPYKSTKRMVNADGKEVPVMHACGHDAHVTWMLGIAKMMARLKAKWKGTLIMVGQPAEENGFGAIAMADEMYKKGVPIPQYLLGMHTGPAPVGYYLNRPGERMAGAVQLDVTFYGVGGHGSTPDQTKDPIVMAANAILQYQTIVSRTLDPRDRAVVTVGAMEAGIDNNVIPDRAVLKLNLRWYDSTTRNIMINRIQKINEGIALANELPKQLYPKLNVKQDLGVLTNDSAFTAKINLALEKIAGPGKNLSIPPVMGSEDVQMLLRDHPKVPYNYFIVGIASPQLYAQALKEGKTFPFSNHNPDFQIDLKAIPYGASLGLAAVLEAFQK